MVALEAIINTPVVHEFPCTPIDDIQGVVSELLSAFGIWTRC